MQPSSHERSAWNQRQVAAFPCLMSRLFTKFANAVAAASGSPFAFIACVTFVMIWALTGPLFGFSDTWQLVINTSTTIVTFLMVFLIQNTQNRDAEAMQVKLDELIRAVDTANNALLDLEELDDEELDATRQQYEQLARDARDVQRKRGSERKPAGGKGVN
jgi:low affinity Fe/Cu permease